MSGELKRRQEDTIRFRWWQQTNMRTYQKLLVTKIKISQI
jgi:hypothetical protein